jgi:hypothetical protein
MSVLCVHRKWIADVLCWHDLVVLVSCNHRLFYCGICIAAVLTSATALLSHTHRELAQSSADAAAHQHAVLCMWLAATAEQMLVCTQRQVAMCMRGLGCCASGSTAAAAAPVTCCDLLRLFFRAACSAQLLQGCLGHSLAGSVRCKSWPLAVCMRGLGCCAWSCVAVAVVCKPP